MESIEQKLEKDKAEKQASIEEGLDELDAFMLSMKSGGLDTKTKISLKHRLVELRQQKLSLERLVAAVQPCQISVSANSNKSCQDENSTNKPLLFGKMKGLSRTTTPVKRTLQSQTPSYNDKDDEAFEEEEDDDGEGNKHKSMIETDACADLKGIVPVISSNTVTKIDSNEEKLDADIKAVFVPDNQSNCNQVIEALGDKKSFPSPPSEKKRKTVESKSKKSDERKVKAKKKTDVLPKYSYDEHSKDYAMWLPPSTQSGDGKTNLNEKFGY